MKDIKVFMYMHVDRIKGGKRANLYIKFRILFSQCAYLKPNWGIIIQINYETQIPSLHEQGSCMDVPYSSYLAWTFAHQIQVPRS